MEFKNDNYVWSRHWVYAQQENLCARCGEEKPLTAHHLKRRRHGGSNHIKNLIGLCVECHQIVDGCVPKKKKPKLISRSVVVPDGKLQMQLKAVFGLS